MRVLFWILSGLALAVGLTLAAKYNAGVVMVFLPPYRVTLSLNLFILLFLAAFLALYGAVRLARHMVTLPAYVREFKESRRRSRAREAMDDALAAFFEGRYAIAEKNAVSALSQGEAPALAALLAARAAHEQRAFDRRDAYLEQAKRQGDGRPVARLVTQAELLLDQRQPLGALGAIKELEKHGRKHSHVLRLELKAQQLARNWELVPPLVAQLEKREALEPGQAAQLRAYAYGEILRRKAVDENALREFWARVPAEHRVENKVALAAASAFSAAGDGQTAVEIATRSLENSWDSDLARFYGTCFAKDVLKQTERAERWLQEHPRDATLLLTLARLCARQELWGKARSYLEASLAVEPGAESHLLMAQLLEKLGQTEDACRHYRQSLELCRKAD